MTSPDPVARGVEPADRTREQRATVTVIIPAYNAARWVAETVEAVVSQASVDLEVILVDDGSDDGTEAHARSAAGTHPLHVIRQSRRGVSAARNAGTAVATGAFIQYVDADDVLLPGTLALRVAALEASGADVAYTDWVHWKRQPDGSFAEGRTADRVLGDRPDLDLFTDMWWPPGALLYRRTIVDRILPWREDLPIIQDARFQLDAALAGGRFEHLPHTGLKYRVHGPESLSRRDPLAFTRDCATNAFDVARIYEARGLAAREREALTAVLGQVARAYYRQDRAAFHTVVAELRRLDPHYVPSGPSGLRLLSRLVGYERAEHLASIWRRGRQMTQAGPHA